VTPIMLVATWRLLSLGGLAVPVHSIQSMCCGQEKF
jgi:hypothetical protein